MATKTERNDMGVMVAVEPTEEQKEALAIPGGEPADKLHVTLVYITDDSKRDLDEETLDDLRAVLSSQAASHEPLEGVVTAMSEFTSQEGNPVQVGLVSAVGLGALRTHVCEALNCKYREDFDFLPHLTLAYQEEPVERPDVDLTFGELVLRHDGNVERWPLGGGDGTYPADSRGSSR